MKEITSQAVSDEQMAHASERFPINPPMNKEEYYYRSIFEEYFPSDSAARSVPSVPSVACSTAEALAWDTSFKGQNEPSGRAVNGIHEDAYSKQRYEDRIYQNARNWQRLYLCQHPEIPLGAARCIRKEWSKPHTGIGSDGLVLIGPSEKGDFSMRIFNADGSEAMMCGNASRCVGKYLYEYGLTDKKEIALETLSGIKPYIYTYKARMWIR